MIFSTYFLFGLLSLEIHEEFLIFFSKFLSLDDVISSIK